MNMRFREQKGNVRIKMSDNGNYVINFKKWFGSKNVAANIDYDDLEDCLYLLKRWYENPKDPDEPRYLDLALEDFFPLVQELVDMVYEGDLEVWEWLQEIPTLVTNNEDLFKRAVLSETGEFPFTEGDKKLVEILSK